MTAKAKFQVYVPTKWGGKLTVSTTAGTIKDLSYPDGSAYTNGTETGEDKHGWYTFAVDSTEAYVVSCTFEQVRCLSTIPWCTWWWPYDTGQDPPHLWEHPASYAPKEDGLLKKYDALNPATTAWTWQNTNAKCTCDPPCPAGLCYAAAMAGLSVAKPAGDKAMGGITFREKDRLGIACLRYQVKVLEEDVEEPGNAQQLFKRSKTNLTYHPDWFHDKLRKRIGGNEGGVLVSLRNTTYGVYKYAASFQARGTEGLSIREINITNVMTSKTHSFTDGTETHTTTYGISYGANGAVDGSILPWPSDGRPNQVWFSKPTGDLVNEQISGSKAKADSIISP